MATVCFERSIEIAVGPARIYEELVDPARQLGLQPLLERVVERPSEPPERHFEALERIVLFGVLALRNRIQVTLRPVEPDRRVDFVAHSPAGIRVHSRFELEPTAGGTRVCEHVTLEVPRLLRRFVTRRASEAQERLLVNLRRRLERASGSEGML
jgi:hypothetical protein